MKEWQKNKLLYLIDLGSWINRHSALGGFIGAALVLGGALAESVAMTWAGGILFMAAVIMAVGVQGILQYVRWRRKTWK